jgi:hypothetical protein
MICTIFAPHDVLAKNYSIKLFESMTLDSGDEKPADKKDSKKKETKKETKKDSKKDTKNKEIKKELTKSKGKKSWKKMVHTPKYKLTPG